MEQQLSRERDDVLLFESPSGLAEMARASRVAPTVDPGQPPALVLYVVSLFGVHNHRGERIDGDALIVRAPNQPEREVLAAVLGCTESQLQPLLDRGGTWAIRQITAIDGHRLHFERD